MRIEGKLREAIFLLYSFCTHLGLNMHVWVWEAARLSLTRWILAAVNWRNWLCRRQWKSEKKRLRIVAFWLIVSIKLVCQIRKRLTTLHSFVKAHLSGAIIARGYLGTCQPPVKNKGASVVLAGLLDYSQQKINQVVFWWWQFDHCNLPGRCLSSRHF